MKEKQAKDIEQAVAGRNYLVHAMYLYGCSKCKHIEPIYLGVGVEGPPELLEKGLYIASPFGGPKCEDCGGDTSHVLWGQDKHFKPQSPPSGARCFVIPESGIDMRYFQSVAFSGKLWRKP